MKVTAYIRLVEAAKMILGQGVALSFVSYL